MIVEKKKSFKKNKTGHLKTKNYKFERVENFKYLGVILNEDNNNQIDLQEGIKNANKTCFILQKGLKIIGAKVKTKEHNKDKMLTYASETWTLTKRDR